MASFFNRINKFIGIPQSEETTHTIFWRAAFSGLAGLSFMVMLLSGAFFNTGLPSILVALAGLLIGIVAFWLFRIVGTLLHGWISRIPAFVFALFFGVIGTLILARFIRFGFPAQIFYFGFAIVIVGVTFLFGSGMVLIRRATSAKTLHIVAVLFSFLTISLGIYFLAYEGNDPYKVSFEQTPAVLLSDIGILNPGLKGSHATKYFTYGSGTDKQREEFRNGIEYKSKTVDASLLLPEWKGSKAKWRERYWGFGVKEFPVNGRVWMPEGRGKFPIVLIVHGNHGMEHHSDPGYAYLGELLSSRGFIAVSIDENFINGTWSGDFMGKEMPTRGWLLLKHLEQWREWNNDLSHQLYQKVDLDNVILAGHSRGGEAAPIAAHFNRLKYFPDNANEKFDFNFGIKGIVSIAPTDKRYDRRINLENINYLSIQGSYDSDEASFFGFRQYQRIKYNDSAFHFKSGLYVHTANHGQFNSVWGKYDSGLPGKWLLNTAPMMTMEAQQQIAKVYISAFTETVLHDNENYYPMFKNSASVSDWLPEEILLNTYKDSKTKELVTYEDDIDLTTGSIPGSSTEGTNLKVWRETTLKFRDKDTQANNVAILGWDEDSTSQIASYKISFETAINVDSASALLISMAQGDLQELKKENKHNEKKDETKENKNMDLNFQIQLTDGIGNEAYIDINDIKKLTPQLKIQYVKLKSLNQDNYGDPWEPTLETFELPIPHFKLLNGILKDIKYINFNFNRANRGVLILDEVSLNH